MEVVKEVSFKEMLFELLDKGLGSDVFLTMTDMIVIFRMSVEGLSLKHLIQLVFDAAKAK